MKQDDLSIYVFGKVQPQAIPLEEAALGAIMVDRSAMGIVCDILQEDSFYSPAHQAIYSAMRRLFDRSRPIDLLTVMEELKAASELEAAGGPAYLAELTHRVASAANIEYHARLVEQKAIRRRLIAASAEITRMAYDETEDEFDVLDAAETRIFGVARNIASGNAHGMPNLSSKFVADFDRLVNRKDGLVGITWGYPDMDYLTNGLQSPDLIIVAGRPGMGKTGFALCIAYQTARAGNGVGIFSMEMGERQLYGRLISIETGLGTTRISNPALLNPYERDNVLRAADHLSTLPITIDDTSCNLIGIRAAARRMVQDGAKLIIVDYIQLMMGQERKGQNRENEVSEISRGLKRLAKELNVPVIALSQLSRAVETRGGAKRPLLSDLRESGSIEQDADIVTFIYRPEYYGIETDEDGNSTRGRAEVIVAKHRNGPLDSVWFNFHAPTINFTGTKQFAQFIESPAPTNGYTPALAAATPGRDEDVFF